ncbi:MAG TPA: MFS transporter, partial [Pseudonocardiaceae bacterium]
MSDPGRSPVAGRWWSLAAIAVTMLAVGLNLTMLNVALPTIAVDLEASTSQLQWFVAVYMLVLAAGLLPAGVLGDRVGQKRLYLGALALFGVASVGCAYAGSPAALIAARVLLGAGAAFLIPLSISLLVVLFAPEERPRAIAWWTTAVVVGIPIGPVLGGALVDRFWWGAAFLINVPLVLAAFIVLARLMPPTPGTTRERIDTVGMALSSAGLVALVHGLIGLGHRGMSPVTLVPALAGIVLLALFGYWLRRAPHPLFDLRMFRSTGFTVGALLTTVGTFALMGALFVLPQYFQAIWGAGAWEIGLRVLPVVAGLLVG